MRDSEDQEVERLRRRLQQTEEELHQFLYVVSHDLRNPLIAIEGMAGLLESEGNESLTPELRDYVRRIAKAAEGLLAKISGLLEMSRSIRMPAAPAPVALKELLAEVKQETKGLFPGRTIEYDLPDSGLLVFAPREQVRRVLAQLLHNAVKFVPAERTPRVAVTARAVPGQVEVTVTDNGCGVAAEHQHRIFEPFQRLQPSVPGLGLGLALTRRLVHAWGGTLQVHSEPGRGSRFVFTVPRVG